MSKKKKKRKIKFNFKPTSQEARRELLESAGMPIEVDQTKPKQRR